MPEFNFDPISPGDFISAEQYNRLIELTSKLSSIYGPGLDSGGYGVLLPLVDSAFLYGRLLERHDDYDPPRYSWEEVAPSGDGEWEVPGGGAGGSDTVLPAFELNGQKISVSEAGKVVILYKGNNDFVLFIDSFSGARGHLAPVRVATTTDVTLSTDVEEGQTIDGVELVAGDRVLIKNQTDAEDNGVYIVQSTGTPVRADDAATWEDLAGAIVFVMEGDENADTLWGCSSDLGGELEVDPITWIKLAPVDAVPTTVIVSTTENIDLVSALEEGQTLNGVVLSAGDLVLVKDQDDATENGVYAATETGTASRYSPGYATTEDMAGRIVSVQMGTENADTLWLCELDQYDDPLGTAEVNWIRVDSYGGGHLPARAATIFSGVLSSDFQDGSNVDGVILATGDRVLIKNQAAPEENGIYTVKASGAPSRSFDANTWNKLTGTTVAVQEGLNNADTFWMCTSDNGGTLESTAVTWSRIGVEYPLTVSDGTTEVDNTTYLLFEPSDPFGASGSGFVVEDSFGVPIVKLDEAGVTGPIGVVGIHNATWMGVKTFCNAIAAAELGQINLGYDGTGNPSAYWRTTGGGAFTNRQMDLRVFAQTADYFQIYMNTADYVHRIYASGGAACAYGCWDGTTAHTGATTTFAGMTFVGGLYISGSLSLSLGDIPDLSSVYQPLDATLTSLSSFDTNGILCQTAADTFAGRTLTGPAAGITVTNGNGVSGNPTLALANDLSAVEGLSSTGVALRTGTDTWSTASDTRVSSNKLELKLTSDRWIGFSLGSF